MKHDYKHAFWFGGVEKYMPMKIYVHGERQSKNKFCSGRFCKNYS